MGCSKRGFKIESNRILYWRYIHPVRKLKRKEGTEAEDFFQFCAFRYYRRLYTTISGAAPFSPYSQTSRNSRHAIIP